MKLISFTVENYRSITKAHKIGINRLAILVGPNNEGKSNILRALVDAMNLLTRDAKFVSGKTRLRFRIQRHYDWERDYPIHLQARQPKGQSIMLLEFQLSEEEIQEFRNVIGRSLTGTLPLKIAIGPDGVDIKVYKKGRGAATLSQKSDKIAMFVADKLDFEYIPAIRTAKSAQEIVEEMVGRELQELEVDPLYVEALSKIAEIQRPILNRLSNSIKDTLVKFLRPPQFLITLSYGHIFSSTC